MRKIPTMFERSDDRRSVVDRITPGCEWVAAGEGRATRKWDGTCCKVENGYLYARREIKPGQATPDDFVLEELDETTGKAFGWVPVGDGPEWRYHNEAIAGGLPEDGTYELIGPKINGNRDHWPTHALVRHGAFEVLAPRDYEGLRTLLTGPNRLDYEGFVFHHPDGRMAKIKARDFPRSA